jgi:hypothetical protein
MANENFISGCFPNHVVSSLPSHTKHVFHHLLSPKHSSCWGNIFCHLFLGLPSHKNIFHHLFPGNLIAFYSHHMVTPY